MTGYFLLERPPLLRFPPLLLADLPALAIFAARALGMPLRLRALYWRGFLVFAPPLRLLLLRLVLLPRLLVLLLRLLVLLRVEAIVLSCRRKLPESRQRSPGS